MGIIWQGKKFSTDISPKGAFSNNSLKYVNTVEFGLWLKDNSWNGCVFGRPSDSLIFSEILLLRSRATKFALYYLSVTDWELGIKNRDW